MSIGQYFATWTIPISWLFGVWESNLLQVLYTLQSTYLCYIRYFLFIFTYFCIYFLLFSFISWILRCIVILQSEVAQQRPSCRHICQCPTFNSPAHYLHTSHILNIVTGNCALNYMLHIVAFLDHMQIVSRCWVPLTTITDLSASGAFNFTRE